VVGGHTSQQLSPPKTADILSPNTHPFIHPGYQSSLSTEMKTQTKRSNCQTPTPSLYGWMCWPCPSSTWVGAVVCICCTRFGCANHQASPNCSVSNGKSLACQTALSFFPAVCSLSPFSSQNVPVLHRRCLLPRGPFFWTFPWLHRHGGREGSHVQLRTRSGRHAGQADGRPLPCLAPV